MKQPLRQFGQSLNNFKAPRISRCFFAKTNGINPASLTEAGGFCETKGRGSRSVIENGIKQAQGVLPHTTTNCGGEFNNTYFVKKPQYFLKFSLAIFATMLYTDNVSLALL